MTAGDLLVTTATSTRRSPASVHRVIASLEARRHVRNPMLWLGVAVSTYAWWSSRSIEWNAGPYWAFPVSFVPAAWTLFILGVVSGGRDHLPGVRPSPATAAVSGPHRIALGRLLGLLAPLVVVALAVAGTVAVGRLEGGYSIGTSSWQTGSAQLSLPEIAQPILLSAMCGVAGVAMGRALRHTIVAMGLGTIVLFAFGLISWAWQWTPAVYVTPVQHQPFTIDLNHADPTLAPAHWWLASPDQYNRTWRRLVVDPVVAAGHDLVLVGATVAFAGWAIRRRAGQLAALAGAALVVIGVVVQVTTGPW